MLAGHRVSELVLHDGSTFTVGSSRLRFSSHGERVELAVSEMEQFGGLFGRSRAMRQVFGKLERVAALELTLLVTGETGTGKEVLARSVHQMSLRAERPFVVLDCGSIPRDLAESVIFGHERGAFTGATEAHPGVFEQARGGTLFLDEIGDMDLDLQRRLLRVLEAREVTRVGAHKPRPVDVRVVAATHRQLTSSINRGTFREDLYFRLAQLHLRLPPLRERDQDAATLALRFLAETRDWLVDGPSGFTDEALQAIVSAPWPGNVRQLRNVIQRSASMCTQRTMGVEDLDLDLGRSRLPDFAIDLRVPFKEAKAQLIARFERQYLTALVAQTQGNLTHASRQAGVARNHLRHLLSEHGVTYRKQNDE
jgi:DNA-binding NtrC family response regulator